MSMSKITLLDRAILNVLAEKPNTCEAISSALWEQTGVDFQESTVRRCLYRMLGLNAVRVWGRKGEAVIWSALPAKGRNA